MRVFFYDGDKDNAMVLYEDEANIDNDSNNSDGVSANGRHSPCFQFV